MITVAEVQVPWVPVRVEPTLAVPVIVGATVLFGGWRTIDVETLHRFTVPRVLVAATRTVMYLAASAATRV